MRSTLFTRAHALLAARPIAPMFVLALVGLLALPLGGCRACDEQSALPQAGGETPATATTVTPLAHLALQQAPWLIHLRNWEAAGSLYDDIRPRILPLTEVGVIETDLRNTLGIDPRHPETLRRIGLDPDGTLMVTADPSGRTFVAFEVTNQQTVADHLEDVLRGEPFRFSGSTEHVATSGGHVYGYRRSSEADIELILVTTRDWAAIVPDSSDMDGAGGLIRRSPGGGMAANEHLAAAIGLIGDNAVLAHLTPDGLADLFADTSIGEALDSQQEQLRAFHGASAFFNVRGDTLSGGLVMHVSDRARTQFQSMFASNERAPDFRGLAPEGTFAVTRMTFDLANAVEIWKAELGDATRARVEENFVEIEGWLGAPLETAVLPALGRSAVLMMTRTRVLSLRRALATSPPDPFGLANALGTVVGVQIVDRPVIEQAMRTIAGHSDGRASVRQDGDYFLMEFNDASIDIGAVVLTDEYLILVPSREREAMVQALEEAQGSALPDFVEPLIADAVYSGAYFDLAAIVSGPIGTILTETWPGEARDALRNLGSLMLHFDAAAALPSASFELRLTPVGAP